MVGLELDPEFKAGCPVCQGDLIGIADWTQSGLLDRFGVIITADCDIQRARPGKQIVFLRVITQREYVDYYWAKEKLEKERDRFINDLTSMANRLRRLVTNDAVDLDASAVDRWVRQSEANDIIASIGGVTDADAQKMLKAIERAATAIGCCDNANEKPCLDLYCGLQKKSRVEAVKTAVGELSRVRDDLFYISGFAESEDRQGYYILLDQIGGVRLDQITDSLMEFRSGAKSVYRFGRLGKQFKYAMAQKFAMLFQRIGLPDPYNKAHTESLILLREKDVR